MRRTFVAVAAALTLAACGKGDPVAEYVADPEAVARGRALFIGTCTGYCHAEGRANGVIPNLFDDEWLHGGTNREIFETISNGVPGTQMVAFGSVFPGGEDDIWKIIAFLRSSGAG